MSLPLRRCNDCPVTGVLGVVALIALAVNVGRLVTQVGLGVVVVGLGNEKVGLSVTILPVYVGLEIETVGSNVMTILEIDKFGLSVVDVVVVEDGVHVAGGMHCQYSSQGRSTLLREAT